MLPCKSNCTILISTGCSQSPQAISSMILLIETLATSKTTSNEINIKVAEARRRREIDTTRDNAPLQCTVRSSHTILTLLNVDPMYQYSLPWYTNLYIYAIQNSDKSDDLQERLDTPSDYFSYQLHKNICRSLRGQAAVLLRYVSSHLRACRCIDAQE